MKENFVRLLTVLLVYSTVVIKGADIQFDDPMWQDPNLALPPPVKYFSKELKELWLQALQRPEVDMKRMAAGTIERAHIRGMTNLEDTIGPLVRELDAPSQHRVVRYAAASALIELNARQAAPVLMKYADMSLEMSCLVEPVLARWNYQPMRDVWLKRLNDHPPSRRRLNLAIDALGKLREPTAAKATKKLLLDRSMTVTLRLAAARALARIQTSDLEETARRLASESSDSRTVGRLMAATLLSEHSGDKAKELLIELALDKQPAVAAIAIRRLLRIEPTAVFPHVPQLLKSRDGKLRRLAAECVASVPKTESVKTLEPLLNDPHPDVRNFVRRALAKFSENSNLADPVIEAGRNVIRGESWRGLEQAAILLVVLDDKSVARRLVDLVGNPRFEVRVAAAWGLRKLAVPKALEGMLRMAKRESKRYREIDGTSEAVIGQLFQAFGQMKYRPAEDFMRDEYLAKKPVYGWHSRAAAAWAIGHLYEGRDNRELAKQLLERLEDVDPPPPAFPEYWEVRQMCAVSLGRMKAKSMLEKLKEWRNLEGIDSQIGYTCAWAIHNITGEPLPKPNAQIQAQTDWFLEPVSSKTLND